jgi:hypothetical protein
MRPAALGMLANIDLLVQQAAEIRFHLEVQRHLAPAQARLCPVADANLQGLAVDDDGRL